MKNNLNDFEYKKYDKIYDKFTKLFVSQKGITDSLKVFDEKIGELSSAMSDFRIKVDKIQEGILKNEHILLKIEVLSKTIGLLVSLSIGSIFMFKEIIHGAGEAIIKFFSP
jgi:peptidoglycan hydrolase CwlO-like protein